MGNTGNDNGLKFTDSFFVGLGRPDCAECYANADAAAKTCRDVTAITLFTVTEGSGEHFPLSKDPKGFDVVCVPPAIDVHAFYDNLEFRNFRKDYSGSFVNCAASGDMH